MSARNVYFYISLATIYREKMESMENANKIKHQYGIGGGSPIIKIGGGAVQGSNSTYEH